MGTADLVPGVSGGTIALITGIYARLLTALSQANGATVMLLAPRSLRAVLGAYRRQLSLGVGRGHRYSYRGLCRGNSVFVGALSVGSLVFLLRSRSRFSGHVVGDRIKRGRQALATSSLF